MAKKINDGKPTEVIQAYIDARAADINYDAAKTLCAHISELSYPEDWIPALNLDDAPDRETIKVTIRLSDDMIKALDNLLIDYKVQYPEMTREAIKQRVGEILYTEGIYSIHDKVSRQRKAPQDHPIYREILERIMKNSR